MDNPRPEKVAVVDEARARLEAAAATIVVEYRGLTVGQLEELRTGLRAKGGEMKVYKNTLVRFAARDLGIEGADELLTGPNAIIFASDDPGAVAKVVKDFAKKHPVLVTKGGFIGTSVLNASGAQALADLPSREQLLAQIAGLFAAPMAQMAGLFGAVQRDFAYAIDALVEKRGGAPEAEGAVEADAEVPAEASAEEAPAQA